MANEPKRLAPNYGIRGHVDAYTDEGATLKRKFLRDAVLFHKAVGAKLARLGLTEVDIHRNEAGIAVSGEVYAWFAAPGAGCGLFVEICTTCLIGVLGRASDGVAIRAVWRKVSTPPVKGRRPQHTRVAEGQNQWLSADMDSDAVAVALRDILTQAPEYGPQVPDWPLESSRAIALPLFEADPPSLLGVNYA